MVGALVASETAMVVVWVASETAMVEALAKGLGKGLASPLQ
jgi:hypothetical protein